MFCSFRLFVVSTLYHLVQGQKGDDNLLSFV